jgi:hypothetical protein
MPADPSFHSESSFEDEKKEILRYVLEWGTGDRQAPLDFSAFESIVCIKNADRVITADNEGFRRYFFDGQSSLGQTTEIVESQASRSFSRKTDELILEGVNAIEMEHVRPRVSGRPCMYITYKRRLDELRDPAFAILKISRATSFIGVSDLERRRSLSELLILLQQLDSIDKTICYRYTNGASSKDIAADVGLATRSVEIRRQKILDHFGFQHPIEIVKMIVRLEEHGLIKSEPFK